MNWVTLPRLNDLHFSVEPVPLHKLRRWCRAGRLPARHFGREWHVDLDALEDSDVKTKRKALAADIVNSILEDGRGSR